MLHSMDYLTYTKRLELVLRSIKTGCAISPHQIAKRYGCSEKTIRRMINHLRAAGYEITYDRKQKKYFVSQLTRTQSVRQLI